MKTTLDELQTLIAIVDSGSITAASEQLEQTTSGVSRTLSRIEKKLGVTLLRRTTRKLDLTEEGETFLEHARGILESFELAEASVQDQLKIPNGLLKIDSASSFVLNAIAPYLNEFQELYPNIRLELYTNDRNIDLLEKKIDIAIRIGRLEDSTLYASKLGASRLRILASPAYLSKYGTPKTVEDLNDHLLIGFTAPKALNNWPLKNGNDLFYTAKLHIAASSGETIFRLLKDGNGIACLSDFMTKSDRDEGSLIQILKSHTLDVRQEIHAVYYKNLKTSQRANLFIEFLKKKLRTLLGV